MKLKELLARSEYELVRGSLDIEISDIIYDSRKIVKDCVFVCMVGANFDGHDFIEMAVEKGAASVVVSRDTDIKGVTVIKTKDTRKTLALISAEYFGRPAEKLKMIGLTGTKGKTTTALMIKSILEKSGIKTGVIGTLGIVIGDDIEKTSNTTPESYIIHRALREMADKGCQCAVMEVSSQALKLYRTYGIDFDYGLFTNLSHDHIGGVEHANMEEYIECKSRLFKQCKVGIVNADDKITPGILQNNTCNKVETFGFGDSAELRAKNEHLISDFGYIGVHFETDGAINMSVDVDIPGKFNVYNALCAMAVCRHFAVSEKNIYDGLNEVKVKGRVETVKVNGNYTLLIDYAHNAMSMENVLETLREYKPNRLITMFGAGGNRSKDRRYEMGEISGKMSDLSVITEDNSRNEDVMDIIADIEKGLAKTDGKYVVIPDRTDAIRYCIENAQNGDIIVLAGKGHEDYQEKNGVRTHYDEREVVRDIIGGNKNVQNDSE